MPIGIIMNAATIFFGGIVGALAGHHLSPKYKTEINLIFGLCSMGMGISSITLMKNMPAVIFAIILGTTFGLAIHLGAHIQTGAMYLQKPIARFVAHEASTLDHAEFMSTLVTVIVLFCASGSGIYGSLDSGMSSDHTILISKSILDFFTAIIFACQLGYVVSIIAIPQFLIFFLLFLGAGMIFPLTSPDMIADFKACGGFLMLATGFRMIKVKEFPIADMIPSMIFVMPLSWLWMTMIVPLL